MKQIEILKMCIDCKIDQHGGFITIRYKNHAHCITFAALRNTKPIDLAKQIINDQKRI